MSEVNMVTRISSLLVWTVTLALSGCMGTQSLGDGVGEGGTAGDGPTEPSEAGAAGGGGEDPGVVEPFCGDGVLDAGEECDDANTTGSDGCSKLCEREEDYACPSPGEPCEYGWRCVQSLDGPLECDPWACPDGVVDPGEECDDGNTNDEDACTNDCTLGGFCGDHLHLGP